MLVWLFHHLWGLKTTSIFDVWSIDHIMSGISIGSSVRKHNHRRIRRIAPHQNPADHSFHFDLVGVLFLAYLWETIEHYLETGLLGLGVEYWFQGVEFWANRIVADPALLVVGYLIAKRYPNMVIPARIFTAVWIFIHVFVFKNSMYLQRFL